MGKSDDGGGGGLGRAMLGEAMVTDPEVMVVVAKW